MNRIAPYVVAIGLATLLSIPEFLRRFEAHQLNWAIVHGDDAAARRFLDRGVSLDQVDLYGYTPREMIMNEDRGYLLKERGPLPFCD